MVSTAAGMARHGLLPVVNSFASFLASRANEQIYNQASEGSKVVYALHYAGLIPAGPGKSHQSLRDISLLAALPNVTIVQPGSSEETRALVRWAVEDAEESVALRLAIGPSPRRIELPDGAPTVGRGSVLREGRRRGAALVRAGDAPRGAAGRRAPGRARRGCPSASWRCRGSTASTRTGSPTRSAAFEHVFVLEDHAPVGGLGDRLRAALARPRDHGLRRRGLARVRDTRRGAALPRARRRVARGADRGARRRPCSMSVEARLGRPPRSALDSRLRRRGDRERARRAARRRARRGVSRASRGGGGVGRARCRTSRCWTATSSPRPRGLRDRALGRIDAWLDRRLGYHPLAIRLNYRHGFHAERMQPGHPNWMLDTDRDGPLPRWPWLERAMERWFFSPRRHVPRRLLETMRRECSGLVLSNVQPASAVPFLAAARRLRLPVVAHVASWDHTVGKGVISPHCELYVVQNTRHGGRPAPLPRRSSPERVRVTGWPQTDLFHRRRPRAEYDALLRAYGLDPRRPLVLVAGNTPSNAPYEGLFVERLVAWWEQGARERVQLLFRPHPRDREWRERFARGRADATGSSSRKRATPTSTTSRRCSSTSTSSSATPGTILLDALVGDRPAVCVLYDEGAPPGESWAAKNVVGKHYEELAASGAFYRAESFDEVVAGIERALERPDELAPSERRGGRAGRRHGRRPRGRARRRRRGRRPREGGAVKLVMTLLARNEADVVDAQLAYHLHAGVDFVIATDNASSDGTTEILERYERAGCLQLLREEADDMRQAEWVTRMARLAATEHGADWVLNADADEFWWPRGGSLKDVLATVPERYGVLRGCWRHFLPRPDDGSFFAERMTVRLAAPAHPGDKETIFHAHQKVAHRAHPEVEIEAGNHNAEANGLDPLRAWHPLEVLHFSFRSVAQLREQGTAAAGSATRRTEPTLHQVLLDEAARDGRVEAFYDALRGRRRRARARARRRARSPSTRACATRCARFATTTGRSCSPARTQRLAFPRPSAAEDAAYAAEASVLVEIDGIVRAEQRVRALERRLDALEQGPLGALHWRADDAGHDAPRAGRDRHRRLVARVPSERRRRRRDRDRQPLARTARPRCSSSTRARATST